MAEPDIAGRSGCRNTAEPMHRWRNEPNESYRRGRTTDGDLGDGERRSNGGSQPGSGIAGYDPQFRVLSASEPGSGTGTAGGSGKNVASGYAAPVSAIVIAAQAIVRHHLSNLIHIILLIVLTLIINGVAPRVRELQQQGILVL